MPFPIKGLDASVPPTSRHSSRRQIEDYGGGLLPSCVDVPPGERSAGSETHCSRVHYLGRDGFVAGYYCDTRINTVLYTNLQISSKQHEK